MADAQAAIVISVLGVIAGGVFGVGYAVNIYRGTPRPCQSSLPTLTQTVQPPSSFQDLTRV